MPIFFALAALLLSKFSAEAATFTAQNPAGRMVEIILRAESDIFYVDEVGRGKDRWPELLRTRSFASRNEATAYVDHNFPGREPKLQLVSEEEAPELTGVSGGIWEVTNSWSWEWEQKYADWTRETVGPKFFVENDLATDCADVAFALRWIFARNNHLPATVRLATGEWFTQNSLRAEWAGLPTAADWNKDKRFLKALNYILGLTYTHTLVDDAYPVAIRMGSLIEGSFQLYISGKSGHTQPFIRVLREGETGIPIEILQSTTPRVVRELGFDGYWNPSLPVKGKGGLLRFRWPNPRGKGLVKPALMPNFSEEQYDPGFVKEKEAFFLAVFRRLWPGLSIDTIATNLLNDTINAAKRRVEIVENGFAFCQSNDCRDGSAGWEDWSTPSRDGRLLQQISQIAQIQSSTAESVQQQIRDALNGEVVRIGDWPISLDQLSWAMRRKVASVDPRDPVALRWGAVPEGLGLYLQKISKLKWQEREALLKSSSGCSASVCRPGNEEWNKRTTFELDSAMVNLGDLPREYCGFSKRHCEEINLLLDRPFDLFPGLTLDQTLNRFLEMNSDPRHVAEVRRRGLMNELFLAVPMNFSGTISSSQEFLMNRADQKVNIWDIRSGARLMNAPHGKWAAADLARAEGWFLEGNVVGLQKLRQKSFQQVSLPFHPERVYPAKEGLAMASDSGSGSWAVLRSTPEGILVVGAGTGENLRYADPLHFFLARENVFYLLSLESGEPVLKATEVPVGESLGYFTSTDVGFFLRGEKEIYLIRRDGSISARIDSANTSTQVSADGRFVFAYSDTASVIYMIDENGRVSGRKDLPKKKTAISNGLVIEDKGETVSYIARKGRLLTIPARSGEQWVEGVQGNYAIARTAEGVYLRLLSESKPLTPVVYNLWIFSGNEAHKDLVRLCDRPAQQEWMWQYYRTLCRVESIEHPKDFSYLTGVADEYYESEADPDKMMRGFAVSVGRQRIWLERKRPL